MKMTGAQMTISNDDENEAMIDNNVE